MEPSLKTSKSIHANLKPQGRNLPGLVRRTNKKSRNQEEAVRNRCAEALFAGFIVAGLTSFKSEGLHGIADAHLLSEIVAYLEHGGKRLRVRLSTGRLQVQCAFDCENPAISYPVVEADHSEDAVLPIFSGADFSYLDGFARDLREKADELGLPWHVAVDQCRQLRDENHISESAATGKSVADKLRYSTVLTIVETADLLKISLSTVYRYLNEGKLMRPALGKRPGKRGKALVLTQSIINLLKESSE